MFHQVRPGAIIVEPGWLDPNFLRPTTPAVHAREPPDIR
jgi:hypothetical protein